MNDEDHAFFMMIVVAGLALGVGALMGYQAKPKVEKVYVYERAHPVRPYYSENIPSTAESIKITRGDREFLLFYWTIVSLNDPPGYRLYWGYRELIK